MVWPSYELQEPSQISWSHPWAIVQSGPSVSTLKGMQSHCVLFQLHIQFGTVYMDLTIENHIVSISMLKLRCKSYNKSK